MEKAELMKSHQYITVKDLEQIFDCSRGSAQRIMRQIKAYSDSLRIKGKVTTTDYEAWFNRPMQGNAMAGGF